MVPARPSKIDYKRPMQINQEHHFLFNYQCPNTWNSLGWSGLPKLE